MSTYNSKSSSPISYYEILQVSRKASDADIKNAYYKLARRFHPDRNPQERKMSELRFRLINEAYANLKTKQKRLQYNKSMQRMKNSSYISKEAANDDYKHKDKIESNWFTAFSKWLFNK